jgi:hypothetical protein
MNRRTLHELGLGLAAGDREAVTFDLSTLKLVPPFSLK